MQRTAHPYELESELPECDKIKAGLPNVSEFKRSSR